MSTTRTPSKEVLLGFWKESFASVMKQLGAAELTATLVMSAAIPAAADLEKSILGRFSAGGALKGQLQFVADAAVAQQLAQRFMSEAPDPAAEFNETHRDAFAELLRQVAGQVSSSWKGQFGAELLLEYQADLAPAFAGQEAASLEMADPQFPKTTVLVALDGNLCGALATLDQPPPAQEILPEKTQGPSGALPPNLQLLLDVELEATIRFGQKDMLLRDIFGLMPGAVVELNQLVNEPAELLVAGRLIARGDVVVVDGNFGLRVTEVATQGQRPALLQL